MHYEGEVCALAIGSPVGSAARPLEVCMVCASSHMQRATLPTFSIPKVHIVCDGYTLDVTTAITHHNDPGSLQGTAGVVITGEPSGHACHRPFGRLHAGHSSPRETAAALRLIVTWQICTRPFTPQAIIRPFTSSQLCDLH